jgi:hypothetical protein
MVVLRSVAPAPVHVFRLILWEVAALTAAGIAFGVAVLYLANKNASQATNAMHRNSRFEG